VDTYDFIGASSLVAGIDSLSMTIDLGKYLVDHNYLDTLFKHTLI